MNLTISARGWHALQEIGADEAVKQISLPLSGRMIHVENGPPSRHLYGPQGESIWSVGRNLLARVLIDIAEKNEAIQIVFGHRLTRLDPASGKLEFEKPEAGGGKFHATADILLLADGSHSGARAQLLDASGDECRQTYVPYWYKEIHVPAPKDGSWPLDPQSTHIWPRKDALLCLFPNANKSFTGSLFMPFHGEQRSFAQLSTKQEVHDFFQREFPDLIPAGADLGHSFFSRPTNAIFSIRCSRWVWNGRYALIGDAAHAITPVLGQGLNCGFEDCSVLNECLDSAGDDWEVALLRYEALRKPNADAVTQLAENHFKELSVNAADPRFVVRKQVENRLFKLYPNRIVPLYTLVAFTRLPYSDAPRIAEAQNRLFHALASMEELDKRWESPPVQGIISDYLATAPVIDTRRP